VRHVDSESGALGGGYMRGQLCQPGNGMLEWVGSLVCAFAGGEIQGELRGAVPGSQLIAQHLVFAAVAGVGRQSVQPHAVAVAKNSGFVDRGDGEAARRLETQVLPARVDPTVHPFAARANSDAAEHPSFGTAVWFLRHSFLSVANSQMWTERSQGPVHHDTGRGGPGCERRF
jgi:hypothetical protein